MIKRIDDSLPVITIVCFANYCRSPVAEYLMKEKYDGKFLIQSAGINPLSSASMDDRSKEYLSSEGIDVGIHNPRRISDKMVDQSKYIFALDFSILMQLNKLYKKNISKIKLLTYQTKNIILNDPYKLNHDEYMVVMNKIKEVVNKIDL